MQYILLFFLFLLSLFLTTETEQEQSSQHTEVHLHTEGSTNEQATEEIREEVEEQRELTELSLRTIEDVESSLIGRIDELREYINGRFDEYATGTQGTSTESTESGTSETETIIQEEIKPTNRHFWFRRLWND
jgi:chaperonin cofactor prefoldin